MEECTDWNVEENENFFITYRSDHQCQGNTLRIRNLFINEEKRNNIRIAIEVKKKVFKLAKENKCNMISGELYFENPHFDRWLKFYEKIGFTCFLNKDTDHHIVTYCNLDKNGKIC